MMRFKNQNKEGFTFVEVLIAMTMLGIVLTSLFNLQTTLFSKITTSNQQLLRIFSLKNILLNGENIEKFEKEKKSFEINLKDINTTVKYDIFKPKDSSALGKLKNIKIVKASVTYKGTKNEREENLIRIIYTHPKDKKNGS